jgi:tetratricopeptide (TPR) repeat protein
MYDDAQELLTMAQSIDSTSFEVNYYLGVCEYYKRQYESAFKHLKIATLAKPENMQSLKYLGFIFFQAQNYKNALMCLNRVQQSDEKTPESTYYFGYALLKVGKREDAYTILSGLINDPDWGGVALKECADISFKSGQYDQAIDLGKEALAKKSMSMSDKDKAEIHYVLGNSFSQMRDTANALQHYNLVKSLSNAYPDINDKIDHLQEIFYNRNLQTFLNANWPDFEKQALAVIRLIFPNAKVSSHQRMASSVGETVDILAEIETRQWQDVVLVRFIRDKNQVGDVFIRDLAARLKEYRQGGVFVSQQGHFPLPLKCS